MSPDPARCPDPETVREVDFCRLAAENAPAGVVVVNARRELLYANATAVALIGDRQAIARNLSTPVKQADPALRRLLQMLERAFDEGQARQFEIDLPDAVIVGGSYSIHMVPLDTADEAAVAIWFRDVSSYRQMSDRLVAAEKMASLGAMAGGVAHHFNTIIGGLTGAVDSALTSEDAAMARRALGMTGEAIASISKLTRSLMSFAEQDKRRMDMADLTEVLLTFVQLVERPLADSGIAVDVKLAHVPIVAVEANRMHQVLGNLLTNAEEAMAEGGTITLATACDEQWVWLDFADTGCGIRPEHRRMVFEPFFTTKGLMGGGSGGNPGLGLSVAHGLVLEMGGEIMIVPAEAGTCLRLRFPKPVA